MVMVVITRRFARLALVCGLLLIVSCSNVGAAFFTGSSSSNHRRAITTTTVTTTASSVGQTQQRRQPGTLLFMADTKEKSAATTMIANVETGQDDDCISDEEYCILDEDTGKMIRLTVEEKERIFLDAVQSYYMTGRQLLNDEDFDLLKEDLQWSGSEVVKINRKEAKYLSALQDYLKGTPSMGDEEFDQLKKDLMEDNSVFAVQTEPKCYIDTGVCKVTLKEDQFRSNLLYLPAGAIIASAWLGVGWEILAPLIKVNPLIWTLLGSPLYYYGSKIATEEFIFVDKKIAYGPCPSCGFENRVYFGNILGVEGFGEVGQVKCPNCKETFNVQRDTLRASTLPKV